MSTNQPPAPPAMPQITTVVMLMLENRSLDNLLGFLYAGDAPRAVFPEGSPATFDGVPHDAVNYHHTTAYAPTNGTLSTLDTAALRMPNYDPNEGYAHVKLQLYADGYGRIPEGDPWSREPPMSGFAWDYDAIFTENQAVMGSYSAAQLPAFHGLAKAYAVSDRWFASVPTQTFANRAYAACGTSLGAVVNSEITDKTFAETPTVFNLLAAAGKSWGVYWRDDGGLAAGSPLFDPFTPYFFPQLQRAPHGGVFPFDNPDKPGAFMQALAAGTLPNFCFLEPKWGGGAGPLFIQGTDYHPPAWVGPGEYALNALYEALVASPQWPNMLFIVTFDEHGGTYDHVPPPPATPPDGVVGASGFTFNRLGVRVPTLLISPFIPEGLVFRSPEAGVDFDHASFIATLLKWAGIDPKTAGMGARVANAPTFEGVLSPTPRADTPRFEVDPSYAKQGLLTDALSGPAPLDASGAERPSVPLKLHEFRAACEASDSPEALARRLEQLRYHTG